MLWGSPGSGGVGGGCSGGGGTSVVDHLSIISNNRGLQKIIGSKQNNRVFLKNNRVSSKK